MNLFKHDNRFHRFLWFCTCSHDTEILDPKRIVELTKRVHGTVIHFPATGSIIPDTVKAFYNSKIIPKVEWIGERDLLAEVIELGHKNNIKIVAYFNGHWFPEEFFVNHPDWILTTKDGKAFRGATYGAGLSPCINNAEFLQYTKDICTELVTNYDIDGIFMDGPGFCPGTCYCKSCQRKFFEIFNQEIPQEDWNDPLWYKFLAFRYSSMKEFVNEIRRAVKQIRDIPVYKNFIALNTTWFNCGNPQLLRDYTDNIGAEHFVFYSEPINTPHWGAAAVAKYLNSITRNEKPATVFLCYGHKIWDYYTLPGVDIQLLIAETAANGAYPFVTIDDYQIVNDPINFQPIQEMFSFIEKNERYFITQHSKNEVCILWSDTTADFYTKAVIERALGTHQYETKAEKDCLRCFRGFYEMLSQAHIPFDIIGNVNLDNGDLKKYKVLIMPNVACLTKKQVEIIKNFVSSGGNLIATFETSLYDEQGNRIDNFQLSDVFGVKIVQDNVISSASAWNYQKVITQHKITQGIVDKFIPLPEKNLGVVLNNSEYIILSKIANPLQHRYARLTGLTEFPGIVIGQYGKGKVAYFSGTVGELFYKFRIRHIRELIANTVEWMMPLQLKTNAPVSVEFTLSTSDDRQLIHIINWSTRISRPVENVVPVYNIIIKIKVDKKVKTVRALRLKKKLKYEQKNNYIRFILPELNLYEIVVIN